MAKHDEWWTTWQMMKDIMTTMTTVVTIMIMIRRKRRRSTMIGHHLEFALFIFEMVGNELRPEIVEVSKQIWINKTNTNMQWRWGWWWCVQPNGVVGIKDLSYRLWSNNSAVLLTPVAKIQPCSHCCVSHSRQKNCKRTSWISFMFAKKLLVFVQAVSWRRPT